MNDRLHQLLAWMRERVDQVTVAIEEQQSRAMRPLMRKNWNSSGSTWAGSHESGAAP